MTARARRVLRTLLLLAAIQGAAVLLYWSRERDRQEPVLAGTFVVQAEPARPAPAIELETHDKRRRQLSDLRGRAVALHFWATWCAPCARELPELLKLGDELENDGVVVLAVSLDDGWANVETFFGGHVPASIVRGVAGDAARKYGVGVLPETVLIRPNGELAYRAKGARAWNAPAARKALVELR